MMERSSTEEVWAAPSLRSGHALSRDKAGRATEPRLAGAAGLVPSGRDRCRGERGSRHRLTEAVIQAAGTRANIALNGTVSDRSGARVS